MRELQIPAIRIADGAGSLSKGQKSFNSQIRQIEKLRKELAAWDTATPAYREQYVRDLLPLFAVTQELQIKLLRSLDSAMEQKGLSRTDRGMLRDLIIGLAGTLLAERGDAEFKAIYNRHSGSDYDSEEAAQVQDMKDMFEDVFGIDLGDEAELDTPEALMQRMQGQLREAQARQEAKRQAQEEKRARRKKTAQQQEKEARSQAEASQMNLSIREIYRKLASALHPDRETDPEEHRRKTALMQRINQAYDKQDLLRLLELQLEVEHIDRDALGRLDEDRLRHYNAILKNQIAELKRELLRVEADFRIQFGLSPFVDIKPDTVMYDLARDILDAEQGNREMEEDLLVLATAKGVKAWLKKIRSVPMVDEFDGLPF